MELDALAAMMDSIVHPDRPITLIASDERNPLVILDGYAIIRISELNGQPAWSVVSYAPKEGELNLPVLSGVEATPDRLSAIKVALAHGFRYIY